MESETENCPRFCPPHEETDGMKPPADGVSRSGVKPHRLSKRPVDGVWMGTSESRVPSERLVLHVVVTAGLLLLLLLLLLLEIAK